MHTSLLNCLFLAVCFAFIFGVLVVLPLYVAFKSEGDDEDTENEHVEGK